LGASASNFIDVKRYEFGRLLIRDWRGIPGALLGSCAGSVLRAIPCLQHSGLAGFLGGSRSITRRISKGRSGCRFSTGAT
jgi:hypothetical protein